MTDQELIKKEIESILIDIIKVYEDSGRKVTGTFAKGLEAIYEPYKATIRGYEYLAGRGKTKNAHKAGEPYLSDLILQWLKDKGIKGRNKKTGRFIKQKSLAWAIAQKIHKEGTKKNEWLQVYKQVITPERIESIIDKVGQLNVNRIITDIQVELELISKEFG